jgi:hypothetical protein
VVDGGGADSILRFRLERKDDGTKHCRNMSSGSELILTSWEGIVTRRGGMTMSVRGEAPPGRENRADDTSWTDVNFTGPKNEKKFTRSIQLL